MRSSTLRLELHVTLPFATPRQRPTEYWLQVSLHPELPVCLDIRLVGLGLRAIRDVDVTHSSLRSSRPDREFNKGLGITTDLHQPHQSHEVASLQARRELMRVVRLLRSYHTREIIATMHAILPRSALVTSTSNRGFHTIMSWHGEIHNPEKKLIRDLTLATFKVSAPGEVCIHTGKLI
jgi:hypothetical protein